MVKTKQLLLAIAGFLLTTAVFGQTVKVSGLVTDASNAPVPGVAILETGTSNGVVTDEQGSYSITVPANATLEISCIGYSTQTIPVSGRTSIDIQLVEDNEFLDEVVVVGYGVQRKSDITGAISSVKANDLENRSATSIVDAMAGKTAGVNIVSTGGSPGESGTMLIRGYSSNNSSYPLYVVDGLRVNSISDLDPNTIESIEVLKDASSAAIYGAEAGNGVIMVTTKKGKSGNSSIMYQMQYTINSLANVPQALSGPEYANWMVINGKYAESDVQHTIDDGLWDGKSTTNWIEEMTENGVSQRHSLSLQGSNDKAMYFASISYTDQNGIVVDDYDTYKRYNGTLNSSYKLRPWIEIGNTTNFMYSETKSVTGGTSLNGPFFEALYWFDPTVSVSYPASKLPGYMQSLLSDGKKLMTDDNGDYYGISYFLVNNPANPWVMLRSREQRNTAFVFP